MPVRLIPGDFPVVADDDDPLAEIQRLYHEMQALPKIDHPCQALNDGRTRLGTAAYRALETRIYHLTRPFWR